MGTRHWLGSLRRPIALMLLVTLVPSILLVALGWRLFREDRDGELRALRERRERAAERVGLALQRALRQVETRLDQADPARDFGELAQAEDAAVIVFRKRAAYGVRVIDVMTENEGLIRRRGTLSCRDEQPKHFAHRRRLASDEPARMRRRW